MQVIINIPDRSYERLQRVAKTKRNMEHLSIYGELILNGKPLPKGHGDLIDRSKLLKEPMDTANYPSNYVRIAKAVIEADKAESEE